MCSVCLYAPVTFCLHTSSEGSKKAKLKEAVRVVKGPRGITIRTSDLIIWLLIITRVDEVDLFGQNRSGNLGALNQ